MLVIGPNRPMPFDVDNTLILYDYDPHESDLVRFRDPYSESYVEVKPHRPHMKLIKNYHARGIPVIVWSANGEKWAEAVVRALGLEKYVTACMTKFENYVDDLSLEEWTGKRLYLDENDSWGKLK